MHVVDWLPTLMNAATNGAWSGPLSGKVIDGVDLWDEIRQGDGSGVGRDEIVFYATEDKAVIQQVGHSLLSRCGFIPFLTLKLNPPILTFLTLLHLQSPLYSPLHSHPHLAAPSILAHPHIIHTSSYSSISLVYFTNRHYHLTYFLRSMFQSTNRVRTNIFSMSTMKPLKSRCMFSKKTKNRVIPVYHVPIQA